MAAIIAIHGIIHFLSIPAGQHHSWTRAGFLALWALTTLLVLAGLGSLGRAYSSLVDDLQSSPKLDISILPEDERQILEPVLDTPGITQVEIIDRSEFSDAKVSQTLKALRERGLVYRERQGRTYRLYPGTVLDETANDS